MEDIFHYEFGGVQGIESTKYCEECNLTYEEALHNKGYEINDILSLALIDNKGLEHTLEGEGINLSEREFSRLEEKITEYLYDMNI